MRTMTADARPVRSVEGAHRDVETEPSGELEVRFDRSTRTAIICLPGAELAFRVVDGAIEISSASAIRIRSGTAVEIAAGIARSGGGITVSEEAVGVATRRLGVVAAQTEFTGDAVAARAELVRVTWGKCERIVGRAFDYARQAYQRVDGLLHVRAGRIRSESAGAHLMRAETTRIEAAEDVRVQGKAINLG